MSPTNRETPTTPIDMQLLAECVRSAVKLLNAAVLNASVAGLKCEFRIIDVPEMSTITGQTAPQCFTYEARITHTREL